MNVSEWSVSPIVVGGNGERASDAQGLQLPERGDGVLHRPALAAVPFEPFDQLVGLHERIAKGRAERFRLLDQAHQVLLPGLRHDSPGLAVDSRCVAIRLAVGLAIGLAIRWGMAVAVLTGDRFAHGLLVPFDLGFGGW